MTMFTAECSMETSQYLEEHLTRLIDIHWALWRFSNFSLVTQIDFNNEISGKIGSFGKVSVSNNGRNSTIEIPARRNYSPQATGISDYGLVFRSPIDSTRTCQFSLRARRVAITYNKSFAMLSLGGVRLSFHAFILLPFCDVVGGVDRCLHYSLYYYKPSLQHVLLSHLACEWSLRM